jgi:hypothetical protein
MEKAMNDRKKLALQEQKQEQDFVVDLLDNDQFKAQMAAMMAEVLQGYLNNNNTAFNPPASSAPAFEPGSLGALFGGGNGGGNGEGGNPFQLEGSQGGGGGGERTQQSSAPQIPPWDMVQ